MNLPVPNINGIPGDVLQLIFLKLSLPALWNSRRTCRSWKKRIEERKRLCVADVTLIDAYMIRCLFPSLTRLRIDSTSSQYRDESRLILEQLIGLSSLRRLRIHINHIAPPNTLALISLIPVLSDLRLAVDGYSGNDAPSVEFLRRATRMCVTIPIKQPRQLAWYQERYDKADEPLIEDMKQRRIQVNNLTTQNQILNEWFATEQSFQQGIEQLITRLQKLCNMRLCGREIDEALRQYRQLLEASRSFTRSNFEEFSANISNYPRMGAFLLSTPVSMYLKLMEVCIMNYNTLTDTLQRLKKNQAFIAQESSWNTTGLGTDYYAILCCSRLPRYQLLLKEYISRYNGPSADLHDACIAFRSLHNIISQINSVREDEMVKEATLQPISAIPPETTNPTEYYHASLPSNETQIFGILRDHLILTQPTHPPFLVIPLKHLGWCRSNERQVLIWSIHDSQHKFACAAPSRWPPRRPKALRCPVAPHVAAMLHDSKLNFPED